MAKGTKTEIVGIPGRAEYRPEYCDMLINHMRGGNTFESFGAVVRCTARTLYNWQDAHEEFLEARKLGMSYLRQFYENLGKTIATGQLQRLVSEKPFLDKNGMPVMDQNGNAIMDRVYAPAVPNAAVFIFLTKNMLGWRNDVTLSFQEVPPQAAPGPLTAVESMETDRIKARMKQLMLKAAADDPSLLEEIKRGVKRT